MLKRGRVAPDDHLFEAVLSYHTSDYQSTLGQQSRATTIITAQSAIRDKEISATDRRHVAASFAQVAWYSEQSSMGVALLDNQENSATYTIA